MRNPCCFTGQSLSIDIFTLIGLAILLVPAPSLNAAELRVGAAAVKITPPLGTPMAGYFGERKNSGVLDDLHAKAMVLDDGTTKVAIVACDLIGLSRAVVEEARKVIGKETWIPEIHVTISATHTHTGPVLSGESKLGDLMIGDNPLARDYVRQLPAWIAESVSKANANLIAVRVSYGCQNESGISFIRRFWMKDGSVGWNPGKLNPNIAGPIGVIDPQINVFYAETLGTRVERTSDKMAADGSHETEVSDRKPVVTYVNFANHLDTTGGVKSSADFPGTAAQRLADYKGRAMLTLFANGCIGNVNHFDVRSSVPQTGPEEAKRIGDILAAAVLKAYLHLEPVHDTTLRVRCEKIVLPSRKFTERELHEARNIVAKSGAGHSFLEQVKAYRIVDVADRQGKPFDTEIQVFALGREIAWVALPGELFAELGLNIKAASSFRQTNVVGLSNGRNQYIPHCSAFAEGEYEPISSRYAEGTGELLTTVAIRLLAELHREAVAKTGG